MKKNSKNAFSLMEMMIVLLVISIIAAATAPLVSKKMARSGGGNNSAISWLGMTGNYGNSGNGSLIIGANRTGTDSKLYINSAANQPQIGFGTGGNLTGILSVLPTGRIQFGGVSGNLASATADNATAIGSHAQAGGASSIALGNNATAPAENSVSIGRNASVANANATNSIAIGPSAQADGIYAVAIGTPSQYGNFNQTTSASNSVSIGAASQASGQRSISIGSAMQDPGKSAERNFASGEDSVSIGTVSHASGQDAVALGRGAYSLNTRTIAIGRMSSASGQRSIAIGGEAQAIGNNSVAIGAFSRARHNNTVVIGSGHSFQLQDKSIVGAESTSSNQIVLGTAQDTVYIPGNLVVGRSVVMNIEPGYTFTGRDCYRTTAGKNMFMDFDLDGADELDELGWDSKFDSGPVTNLMNLIDEYNPSAKGRDYVNTYRGRGNGPTGERTSATSDRRLKNVGEKFTSGLEQIKKLDLYNFTFKADKSKTPQVGVLAQDLQKVFPNAVWKGEDGYLRIRWDEMFYAVINAVKELDAKITTAFEQIKANTDKVAKLEAKVKALEAKNAEYEKQNAEFAKQNADILERLAKLEKKAK